MQCAIGLSKVKAFDGCNAFGKMRATLDVVVSAPTMQAVCAKNTYADLCGASANGFGGFEVIAYPPVA